MKKIKKSNRQLWNEILSRTSFKNNENWFWNNDGWIILKWYNIDNFFELQELVYQSFNDEDVEIEIKGNPVYKTIWVFFNKK